MPLNAGTFMTILRETTFDHPGGRSLRFLFKDLELTAAGFRAVCRAEDSSGTREYSILFSLNRDKVGGCAAAVYTEDEWQGMSWLRDRIQHQETPDIPVTAPSADERRATGAVVVPDAHPL